MTKAEYFTKRHPTAFPIWQQATVGIAGAGGLGSNIALALGRAGIGRLIIADFDTVSLENLNRQQFTLQQVGQPKVTALKANILAFNPFIELTVHQLRIEPANIESIFGACNLLIEAFDDASQKEMLINYWFQLQPQKPIIAASGIAGFGNNDIIGIHKYDQLYIVGDMQSNLEEGISPIAPRVAVVANMQANLALELIVERGLA
jgi:sulfur carrier protein ThiS adenylyltransferase